MSAPVMVMRTVLGGRGFTVSALDDPDGRVLAVALRQPDGWAVVRATGEVVARRMAERYAKRRLDTVGREVAARPATRALVSAVSVPGEVPAW